MDIDQPRSDRPAEPRSDGGASPAGDQRSSRERLREVTGALAVELSGESLPSGPVSPEALRELAASLATELLDHLVQTEAPADDVQGFAMLPHSCTGATFHCGGLGYSCAGGAGHSCTQSFLCDGMLGFSCTVAYSSSSATGA
jgi:hypothetical protein